MDLQQQGEELKRGLKNRHIQLIALGGAIGTGLFLGSASVIQSAGPGIILGYAIAGFIAFLIMRQLGEMVVEEPVAGSFSHFAYKYWGGFAGFASGWNYWVLYVLVSMAELTAVGIYVQYWWPEIPTWMSAAFFFVLINAINLSNVKAFGEMEFWFALIKVAAISLFLVVGTALLGGGFDVAGRATGLHLVTENGGLFPNGLMPALVLVQGVVFAFAGVELVGTAAGECKDARKILPRAINSVIWRIALFYVGAVTLLVLLLPWNAYKSGESPFVTFFGALGVPGIGSVMNIVVLTAALSSLNSGLYSTGRVLRSLAQGGSAPQFLSRMSAQAVPYAGILVTLAIYVFGVLLNYLVPSSVFEIVLNIASLGILSTWGFIVVCQIMFRRAVKRGEVEDVPFKMPGAPVTSWLTLGFLVGVLVLMAFDYPNGTYTVAAIPFVALLLWAGWKWTARHRQMLMPTTIPSVALTQNILE
jgi:L-asparagine permease